jgi:transposase InsO family protein
MAAPRPGDDEQAAQGPANQWHHGICERFHKTVLNEFYRVAFRKKVYASIDELQADLDEWIRAYNESRPRQGRWCFGKTPM